jgi:PEP-CTERM motif
MPRSALNRRLTTFATGTALAALLASSPPAEALTVGQGDDYIVSFEQAVTGTGGVQATLEAALSLTNFDFSGTNTVTFHVDVSNTTEQGTLTAAQWASVRLTSFAFNIDPNAISVTDTSGAFTTAVNNQNLPSIGNNLDFCAYAGPNCSGGSNDGLRPVGSTGTPTSDSFNVTLTFSTDINELHVGIGDNEVTGFKFQTDFGSFEGTSTPPDGGGGGQIPVPEPTSLALFGSALVAFGLLRRRRQTVAI